MQYAGKRWGEKAKAVMLAAVIFPLVACLVAGGCGGEKADPVGAFQIAASALRETTTVHVQVEGELSPREGDRRSSYPFQGDLWMDVTSRSLEARMVLLGMELMARYVRGEAFLQWGGKWFSLPQEGSGVLSREKLGAAVEAFFALPHLLSWAEAEPAGEGEAGSFKVYYLDLRIDYRKLEEREEFLNLVEAMGKSPADLVMMLEGMNPRIRVGVEKKEKVLREVDVELDIETKEPIRVGGMITLPPNLRFKMRGFFPEFGMEVKVVPPSQAEPFRGF